MRKVFIIAGMSLLQTVRDKKALAFMLLFPGILIGILGNALTGMIEDGRINPFPVIVVSADQAVTPQGPPRASLPAVHFGQIFLDDVLDSQQVKNLLQVTILQDLTAARSELLAGRAVAVVHLPATFTANVLTGKETAVALYTDPGRPTQVEIVTQIVASFTEGVTTGSLIGRHLGPEAVADLMAQGAPKLVSASTGARGVSAMQYYAAAMAIMFMMMTALTRARNIILERQTGTLSRMLVSPTSKLTVLAGQILGSALLVYAQFVILVIGTHLLFGVYWGDWLPALLLGAAFAIAASGLGMTMASIMNDPKAADAAVGVMGNIFAALSGAMAPIYLFPTSMKMVAQVIPNYWALQGFLDLMSGAGLTYLWLPVLVLLSMGTLAGIVGSWRLSAAS